MKYSLITILSLVLYSCSDNYQELRQDMFIQKHFNREQSKDLAKIVRFFDEKVCTTTGREGIQGLICYRDWFDMAISDTTHSIPLQLSKEAQWEFSNSLLKESIGSIWRIKSPSKTGLYKELPQLKLYPGSPYMKWLKVFSEDDGSIKKYYTAILNEGIDATKTRAIFGDNYSQWPVSDPRYRLIIAIDRLTLNSM